MLKETIGKLEKYEPPIEPRAADAAKGPQTIGITPMPLPSPLVKGSATVGVFGAAAMAPAPIEERVIGVMNGREIFVLDGVVRKRDIVTPAPAATKR